MNYVFVCASPNLYESLNGAFAIIMIFEIKDLLSIAPIIHIDTFQPDYKKDDNFLIFKVNGLAKRQSFFHWCIT